MLLAMLLLAFLVEGAYRLIKKRKLQVPLAMDGGKIGIGRARNGNPELK